MAHTRAHVNRARSSAKLTRISATKPAILSRPGLRIVLGHAVAFDAFLQRDATAVLEGADELAAHCAEHGFPYWGAIALFHRGNQ